VIRDREALELIFSGLDIPLAATAEGESVRAAVLEVRTRYIVSFLRDFLTGDDARQRFELNYLAKQLADTPPVGYVTNEQADDRLKAGLTWSEAITPTGQTGAGERPARPGETCTCGRAAALVFLTPRGEVPYCGRDDGGRDTASLTHWALTPTPGTTRPWCDVEAGRCTTDPDGVDCPACRRMIGTLEPTTDNERKNQ